MKGSRSPSDHPLADPKAARAIYEALPAGNPTAALEQLSQHLETLLESNGIRPARMLEIIDQLDAAAKPFQRRLSQDFIAGTPGMAMATRIVHVMGTFWWRLAAAYRALAAMHESADSAATALRGQPDTVCARALRAACLDLKWRLFRYSPVDARFWSDVGRVYQIAEAHGCATGQVTVYPGLWGQSTVQCELLKVLMLSASSTDSLPAVQVEIVERIVAQFARFFELRKQASTGCHFRFDIGDGRAPARLADRVALAPSLRFFGPGEAALELEALAASVSANGAVPSSLNLGGDYPPDVVAEAIRHLARYWAPSPPARKEPRMASRLGIDVVHGFDDVMASVRRDADDLDFDERRMDRWMVADESAGGFGAVAPAARTDWLQIGTLLGTRYQDGAAWGVGIVRRINLDGSGNRCVGIEMFAKGVTTVRLLPLLPDGRIHPDDELGAQALLLPSAADNSVGRLEVTLVMRLGAFSPHKSHGMRMHQVGYLLVPARLLEAGQDFDLAEYRIMHRQG